MSMHLKHGQIRFGSTKQLYWVGSGRVGFNFFPLVYSGLGWVWSVRLGWIGSSKMDTWTTLRGTYETSQPREQRRYKNRSTRRSADSKSICHADI